MHARTNQRTVGDANPKFFVLAQYTRHVRPGATIIDGGEGIGQLLCYA